MARRSNWHPDRGDLVWLQFDPQSGREQTERRPALVLSPGSYNHKVGLALLCPITSVAKGYPFEIPLPDGLEISGFVLSDQVKSMDWRVRRADKAAEAPADVVASVLERIGLLLRME
jgi:mRNA interferase MazF